MQDESVDSENKHQIGGELGKIVEKDNTWPPKKVKIVKWVKNPEWDKAIPIQFAVLGETINIGPKPKE